MANGEIDFKELLANINLFAKLIQISHDLNTFLIIIILKLN